MKTEDVEELVYDQDEEDELDPEEELEKAKDQFLKDNDLDPAGWENIILSVPTEDNNEFYLQFDALGNKHYIEGEKATQLAEWMKLTEELFFQ